MYIFLYVYDCSGDAITSYVYTRGGGGSVEKKYINKAKIPNAFVPGPETRFLAPPPHFPAV